jgi:hypothetical protein
MNLAFSFSLLVESPEDLRPSTIASSIISKSGASKPTEVIEEPWSIDDYGECESCEEDYISDNEDEDEEQDDNLEDEVDDDDEDISLSGLSEQDRQRAMGMTIKQLRAMLPQEEGTVWRVSGQRLEKITLDSIPPIGVFECGEVRLFIS